MHRVGQQVQEPARFRHHRRPRHARRSPLQRDPAQLELHLDQRRRALGDVRPGRPPPARRPLPREGSRSPRSARPVRLLVDDLQVLPRRLRELHSCSSRTSSERPAIKVSSCSAWCPTPDAELPDSRRLSFSMSSPPAPTRRSHPRPSPPPRRYPRRGEQHAANRGVPVDPVDGSIVGSRDCPSRAPAMTSSAASDSVKERRHEEARPTSEASRTPASRARARLADHAQAPSTSAILQQASKVVFHSSLP